MKSIAETRRARLKELVSRYDQGRAAALTKRMGWTSQTLASRYLSDVPSNQKDIGKNLARQIEKAYGVSPNFLDTPPELGPLTSVKASALERQLLAIFQRLSTDSQERTIGLVQRLYLQEHPPDEAFGPTVFESDVRERHEAAQDAPRRRTPSKT